MIHTKLEPRDITRLNSLTIIVAISVILLRYLKKEQIIPRSQSHSSTNRDIKEQNV
jgi:hypothetical protein